MKKESKCKVCGKTLVLTIDDDYAAMGDPQKLSGLATCNPCYDNLSTRSNCERQVFRACRTLAMQPRLSSEIRTRIRDVLVKTTKSYALAVAEFFHAKEYMWDEEFVNMLMDMPEKAGVILTKYKQDVHKNAGVVTAKQPYAD